LADSALAPPFVNDSSLPRLEPIDGVPRRVQIPRFRLDHDSKS